MSKYFLKIQKEFAKTATKKQATASAILTTSQSASHNTFMTFITKEESSSIKSFIGDQNETNVENKDSSVTVYCGCGPAHKINRHVIRTVAAFGIQKAQFLRWQDVSVIFPIWFTEDFKYTCIEGILLGMYLFDDYKSTKLADIHVEIVDQSLSPEKINELVTVCNCVNYARDMVNKNASEKYPEKVANDLVDTLSPFGMKIDVLNEVEIKKQNMGLLQAVSDGAAYPPRFVTVQYQGNPISDQTIALVGKGIIFDTGGLNLKDERMHVMRKDIAGCATVAAVLKAAGTLKLPVNLIGIFPLTYNSIDAKSYFPGDIYKAFNGKTVEIMSTDAEGRLILADALSYCQKNYHPSMIIDLATLTATIIEALGKYVAGLFASDSKLANDLMAAGQQTNERLWPMPLYDDYFDSIRKSDIADLRNTFEKQPAKAIVAAAFLKEFVDDGIPWAHLDIAGTAFNENINEEFYYYHSHGEIPHYATGFGVRLLWEFLKLQVKDEI